MLQVRSYCGRPSCGYHLSSGARRSPTTDDRRSRGLHLLCQPRCLRQTRRGIALVALGLAIGLVAAFGLTRLLEGMLFNTVPTDPTTFVFVSVFFSLVGLVACLIPAWRALRVDPVVVLQSE